MDLGTQFILVGVLALFLLGYLVYTLIYPENF
jgi:K+-transporting ATPase KdpF subunit